LLLGELYFAIKMTRGEATNSDRAMAKWLAIAAVPFALIVVHAPHGGLFAVIKARDFWASPLLPPHFAVAALLSGTAMVMIVAIVSSAIGGRDLVSKKTLAHMGALLAAFIVVAAFMDFFDWLVAIYSDEAAGNSALHILSDENIVFSIVHVGGYALALAVLLLNQGRSVGALAVASVLAVLAVASYRYNLTSVGQEVPLYPFLENASYSPTWVEISVALGIVALITLAYSVITRVIPLDQPTAEE
jgi:molybdopterin-containing oxidoreductase family membrane subunit